VVQIPDFAKDVLRSMIGTENLHVSKYDEAAKDINDCNSIIMYLY